MKRIVAVASIFFRIFALVFLNYCLILNGFAQKEFIVGNEAVVRIIECPTSSDQPIKVTIHIDPNKIVDFESGFQRLLELIPDGFTATTDSSENATSVVKDGTIKFFWMQGAMSKKSKIIVSYQLQQSEQRMAKNIIIVGTFKYTSDNERRESQIYGDHSCTF